MSTTTRARERGKVRDMYVILEHHETTPERKRYWATANDQYSGAQAYQRMNRLIGRVEWDDVAFQLGPGLRGRYKGKVIVSIFPVIPVDAPDYGQRVMDAVKSPGGYEQEQK